MNNVVPWALQAIKIRHESNGGGAAHMTRQNPKYLPAREEIRSAARLPFPCLAYLCSLFRSKTALELSGQRRFRTPPHPQPPFEAITAIVSKLYRLMGSPLSETYQQAGRLYQSLGILYRGHTLPPQRRRPNGRSTLLSQAQGRLSCSHSHLTEPILTMRRSAETAERVFDECTTPFPSHSSL